METENILILDKLTIAVAELNTAIYHFFTGDDDISVHVLAMASHEIFGKLVDSKGGTTITATVFSSIKDRVKKEMWQRFTSAYNGFKHLNFGVDEKIKFDSGMNELIILSSVTAVKEYFPGVLTKNMTIFFIWFETNRKEYLTPEMLASLAPFDVHFSGFKNLPKREFFQKIRSLMP